MPVSVTMPRLGESVTEGTVTRWLKREGDRVEVDEPLLEVSTDKVDTEIPAPAAGVLSRIVVGEDETAEVGSELAVIDGDGDGAAAPAAQPQQEAPEPAEVPSTETPVGAEQPAPAAPPAGGPAAEGVVVRMPALGESVTEGTVTRWLKQVGDAVEADEPLLEVSTDKVDTEIPAPAAGTLLEIKANEDDTVPVGADLAVIGSAAGAPTQAQVERTQPAERNVPGESPATPPPAAEQAAPAAAPPAP
ncbi:biotin/lipoyl-containing protein, partial [Rhizomonospora bruguierae]|uniref:biotin/lipoyl-containing protein n=1 Tax=Rhizomonospora bruguierae TaxID=1581705 RepID=UPI0024BD7D8F